MSRTGISLQNHNFLKNNSNNFAQTLTIEKNLQFDNMISINCCFIRYFLTKRSWMLELHFYWITLSIAENRLIFKFSEVFINLDQFV